MNVPERETPPELPGSEGRGVERSGEPAPTPKHSTPPRRAQGLPAIGAAVGKRTLGSVLRDLDRHVGHTRAALFALAKARTIEERAAAVGDFDLARAGLDALLRAGVGGVATGSHAEGA